MGDIKIKKEFLKTVVAFGKSGLPLGERDDLHELALYARQSNDPEILKYFEGKLPTLAELKKAKTDAEVKEFQESQPKPEKGAKPAKVTRKTLEEKKIIDAAVPAPFNKNTRVDELNEKAPSSGADNI